MKVAVLGAGAWGTALAKLLNEGGHTVTLWGHNAAHLDDVRRSNRNERYLPGIALPAGVCYESAVEKAVAGTDSVVVAVPSKAFRAVTGSLTNHTGVLISVTKGIEFETGLTMSGILREVAPKAGIAALSNLKSNEARSVSGNTDRSLVSKH